MKSKCGLNLCMNKIKRHPPNKNQEKEHCIGTRHWHWHWHWLCFSHFFTLGGGKPPREKKCRKTKPKPKPKPKPMPMPGSNTRFFFLVIPDSYVEGSKRNADIRTARVGWFLCRVIPFKPKSVLFYFIHNSPPPISQTDYVIASFADFAILIAIILSIIRACENLILLEYLLIPKNFNL